MMKTNTFLITLLLCFIGLDAYSQSVTFSNQSDLLQPVSGTGNRDCVVDVNIDGYDDVVRITGSGMYIDYQQPDGSFTAFYYAANWENPPNWSISSGDLNDDGYRDFCFGNGNAVSFVHSSEDGTVWTETSYPEYIFSQRSSMNDIDSDGDLDAFVCHDEAQSHVYWNDGQGNMTLDISSFETFNGPGNYANMWCDVDNDGDTDFYLTKCRQGGSPGDNEVINRMYINNGNGTFSERGAETNTNDSDQSWTTVFEDFDNDGDFDLFTVNHEIENRLQWNDGNGVFSANDLDNSGIENDLGAWELDAHDFNNDGWVDIITEHNNPVYYNDGDGTFTPGSLGFNGGAFGDLNNDGFIDCMRGNTLFINDGNDNNYVKVNLSGIISNTDGIGARVTVETTNGMSQIREVRSGRSFSRMSNLSANFGLGDAVAIDKITVKWPSGVITVLNGPDINTTQTIIEVDCLTDDIEIQASGATTICEGSSITLTAPAGGESYAWSNGEPSESISVDASGVYSVVMFDQNNCAAISNNIAVDVLTEEVPEIQIQGETMFCEGGSIILTSSEANGYTWSESGSTDELGAAQSIEITETGDYIVSTEGICFDEASESVHVEVLANSSPDAADVVVGESGDVVLNASGSGTLIWYSDEALTDEIGTGTSVTIPNVVVDESFQGVSYWVTNSVDYPGETASGGKESLGNYSDYDLPQSGGHCLFNVFEEFTLVSTKVYAAGNGSRTFQLTDNSVPETVVEEITVDLVDGENVVEFNWTSPIGDGWSIRSPQLNMYRNDAGLNYPYAIADVGSIYTSSFGNGYYYYFYDWQVKKQDFNCVSEPTEVSITFVSVEELSNVNGVELFPNPVVDQLTINFNAAAAEKLTLEVVNSIGQVVMSQELVSKQALDQRLELDVNGLESGVYLVRFAGTSSDSSKSFVKK